MVSLRDELGLLTQEEYLIIDTNEDKCVYDGYFDNNCIVEIEENYLSYQVVGFTPIYDEEFDMVVIKILIKEGK